MSKGGVRRYTGTRFPSIWKTSIIGAPRAAEILKDYVRLTPRNGQYTPQLLAERQAFIQRVLNLHPNAKPKIQRSL